LNRSKSRCFLGSEAGDVLCKNYKGSKELANEMLTKLVMTQAILLADAEDRDGQKDQVVQEKCFYGFPDELAATLELYYKVKLMVV
jgi:hypothetical protein